MTKGFLCLFAVFNVAIASTEDLRISQLSISYDPSHGFVESTLFGLPDCLSVTENGSLNRQKILCVIGYLQSYAYPVSGQTAENSYIFEQIRDHHKVRNFVNILGHLFFNNPCILEEIQGMYPNCRYKDEAYTFIRNILAK